MTESTRVHRAHRSRDHYSYDVYADPAMARSFDERRFGGPIGQLVAAEQARVLANMIGRIHERSVLDVGTGAGRAALHARARRSPRHGRRRVGADARR